MRIVAIRGRNLASLAGDFAVELDAGPLAGIGLFAITGPTGAGKSTLLDAMCLALYNEMPRLVGRGPLVGRDEEDAIAATDVRSVLRRGAGAGFAEVEFVGREGRRWRARWTVRRAREKAEGKHQPVEWQLEDLTQGRRVSGGLREVAEAVKAAVGLDYEQFRRSALLAQGDFAAFLKAPAAERARLLEAMTGTRIYAEISRRAYERAQAEEAALDKLREQAAGTAVKSPEERAALEAEQARATDVLATARRSLEEAERAVRWHAEAAARTAELASAEAEREAARAAWEGAEALRGEVVEVERAETLRARVEAADRAAAEAKRTAGERAARASERDTAEAAAGEAEARAKAAAAAREQAEAASAALEPPLREARELDALLARARAEVERARGELGVAEAAVKQAATEAARIAAEQRALAEQRDAAKAWLDAHAFDERLATHWARWREDLHRFVKADREVRAALDGRASRSEAWERAVGARKAAAVALEGALARRDEAQRAAEAAQAAAAAPGADLPQARADAQAAKERARAGLQAVAEGARLEVRRAEAARAADAAEAARAAATTAGDEARRRRTEASARAEEAARSARHARAELDLTAHRALLREGEACPLCGATEHPYAAGTSPLASFAEALERRHAEVLDEVRALDAEIAAAGERASAEARRAAEAADARDRAAADLASLAAGQPGGAGVAWLLAPETATALQAGADAAERALADVAEKERALALARAEAQRAQAKSQAASADWEKAGNVLREAERVEVAAERALHELDAHRDAQAALRTAAWEALAEAFPEGEGDASPPVAPDVPIARGAAHAAVHRDAIAFGKACAARAEAWEARRKALAEADEALAALAPRASAATAREEEARAAAREKAAAAEARVASTAALVARRAPLLGGRATDDVEREAREALAAARTADTGASGLASRARAEATAAAARLADAEATAGNARAEAEAGLDALDAAATAAGMAVERARALLQRGPDWLQDRRRALAALREALDKAGTVAEERRARLDKHLATDAPAATREEADAAAAARRAEVEAAGGALQRARLQIAMDDQARSALAALLPRIEAQAAEAERWQQLNALVGSKEGDKFRRFAQGLTLDALLGLANEHLRELAPRYRLVRVPGQDLDLQVIDRDLGDEPRGVQSLSGGESFLASLALALGLASLASQDTRVDSLFIDEGFGTLDPATLETALATLDALQSAGRKVGLISHVPGMAERIGAQVRVEPQGAGRSRVVVIA